MEILQCLLQKWKFIPFLLFKDKPNWKFTSFISSDESVKYTLQVVKVGLFLKFLNHHLYQLFNVSGPPDPRMIHLFICQDFFFVLTSFTQFILKSNLNCLSEDQKFQDSSNILQQFATIEELRCLFCYLTPYTLRS